MNTSSLSLDDVWESQELTHDIIESSSEVDGVHILAKVKGPAFFPDTVSGNKVFYSREAWENAINDERFQSRLRDRLVFGTIGHGQVINDDAIKDGKFSHVLTGIYINESGVGIAEYLILNTPPGRILNTVLRAKSRLRVSTKAKGVFENQSSSGLKSVNPKVFFLERIDFVLDPGYDQALPELIESLGDSNAVNFNKETQMSGNIDPTQKLVDVLESTIADLKSGGQVANETIINLNTQLAAASTQLKAIQESKEELEAKVAELEAELQKAKEELAKYDELGSPDEVSEALDKSLDTITRMQKIIDRSTVDVAESLKIEESLKELEAYRSFGSIGEIKELCAHAEKLADRFIEESLSNIQTKYGVSKDVVKKLYSKGLDVKTIEESIKMIQSVKPSGSGRGYNSLSTKDFRASNVKEISESDQGVRGGTVKSLAHKLLSVNR